MTRSQALEKIITFDAQREQAFAELAKYGYDSDKTYFTVSKPVLKATLTLFLEDMITADELEEWANFIECRDDINYDEVEDYIYFLANPTPVGEITKNTITKMVEVLTAT